MTDTPAGDVFTPLWMRCGDTIHADAGCYTTARSKKLVRWMYAAGRSVAQVNAEMESAWWLRKCRVCWPTEEADNG